MRRCLHVLLALCWALWSALPSAAASQEQRLFWARFAVDAEVTQLVLHGAGRESWTTTWRPTEGELGAAEHWLPIALGSDFELQMGAPVRADDGPGAARFLEWASPLPEFTRDLPLEVWSRALPRDASAARGWSLSVGLGLTAVGLALFALGSRRRSESPCEVGSGSLRAWRGALGALLLGGGAACLTALRLKAADGAPPWTVYELGGPQGTPLAAEPDADPRGIKQVVARDVMAWEPLAGESSPPPIVLRTDPPGAAVQLSSAASGGWEIESQGSTLALAEPAGLRPLGAPIAGPHPLAPELWGAFADRLAPEPDGWSPGSKVSASGSAWAFWGPIEGGQPVLDAPIAVPAWLVFGLPSGRETLLICDLRQRVALRWVGLGG